MEKQNKKRVSILHQIEQIINQSIPSLNKYQMTHKNSIKLKNYYELVKSPNNAKI